jgi:hypothetical protein
MKWIDHPLAQRHKDSAPESISNSENCPDWSCDLDSPNESEDNCEVDDESNIEWDNDIKDSESRDLSVVSAPPNAAEWIRPT